VFKAVLALVAYLAKIEKFYEFLLPNAFYPVIHLIYYIVIVGFVEEFVYRIYIQGTLEEVLGKLSFLAPVISGVIFGLSHSVNNSMVNALINIFVGIVWGYVRYFNKKATFTAMVLNHGLSNELTEIVSIIGSIVLYG
jgi:membrane protease YdiL (CAAX protease family)